MNTATKYTLLRIILVPFMIIAFFWGQPWSPYVSTIIFIIAACTDFVDGYVARKFNQITNIGKFLDPIADKVLVFVAFLIVIEAGNIIPRPWGSIVIAIMVLREFAIAALRQVAAANGVVIAADKLGKLKTVVQDIVIPFMFLLPVLAPLWIGFTYFTYILLVIASILTIWSGIKYVINNINAFKEIE